MNEMNSVSEEGIQFNDCTLGEGLTMGFQNQWININQADNQSKCLNSKFHGGVAGAIREAC